MGSVSSAAACLSKEYLHGRLSRCTADPTFNRAAEAAPWISLAACVRDAASGHHACRRCPILIVGPKIVKDNWRSEFRTW